MYNNAETYGEVEISKANDDSYFRKSDVVDFVESYIFEIITESGVDKNLHTNTVLRSIVRGLDNLPTIPQTFKPIAEIKVDTDEVVKRVIEDIKSGKMQLDIPQTDSVLEDIKKELENMQEEYANIDDGRFWGIFESLKIINKHISGKEKE